MIYGFQTNYQELYYLLEINCLPKRQKPWGKFKEVGSYCSNYSYFGY